MVAILQNKKIYFWLKWSVFNFFIVAILGVMMRYNILFTLPFFEHRFMQQSHSHFAFYGWVTSCIYALVYYLLKYQKLNCNFFMLELIMLANQIGAFGMLFSFLARGYYWLSIVFSSISFLAGIAYFLFLLKTTKNKNEPFFIWLKAGGFFIVLSAIGIFGLAYFTSRKEEFDVLFRASTYFYLHFQYNGFFTFSCIGFFLFMLQKQNTIIPDKLNKKIFNLFFIATLFGYGLSILWISMPFFLLLFWIFIASLQLYATILLINWLLKNKTFFKSNETMQKILYSIFGFGFVVKPLLVLLSTIPDLTQFVFFNLNIVIAYLHLVLLQTISVFLIAMILKIFKPKKNKFLNWGVYGLITGILLNEFFLVRVGSTGIFKNTFTQAPLWLFMAALLIMISILVFFCKLKNKIIL